MDRLITKKKIIFKLFLIITLITEYEIKCSVYDMIYASKVFPLFSELS